MPISGSCHHQPAPRSRAALALSFTSDVKGSRLPMPVPLPGRSPATARNVHIDVGLEFACAQGAHAAVLLHGPAPGKLVSPARSASAAGSTVLGVVTCSGQQRSPISEMRRPKLPLMEIVPCRSLRERVYEVQPFANLLLPHDGIQCVHLSSPLLLLLRFSAPLFFLNLPPNGPFLLLPDNRTPRSALGKVR